MVQGISALAPGACPPLPLGVCRAAPLMYSHSSLSAAVAQSLFPLLKSVIPEVLALSPMGPTLSSSGSILEPAGIGPYWTWGKLQQLLTEATSAASLLPVFWRTNLMQKFLVTLMHVFLQCMEAFVYFYENLGLCFLAAFLTSQFDVSYL